MSESATSAEGLDEGKTRIKYKDVDVGRVQSIQLDKELTHVRVTASMVPEIEPYLTDSTRFWVVRARIGAGEVSGLGTLFSGAYIAMDPGGKGSSERSFKGLEAARVHQILAVLEKHAGISFSDQEVYVSLAGGINVKEPASDLPVALALASSRLGRPIGRVAV